MSVQYQENEMKKTEENEGEEKRKRRSEANLKCILKKAEAENIEENINNEIISTYYFSTCWGRRTGRTQTLKNCSFLFLFLLSPLLFYLPHVDPAAFTTVTFASVLTCIYLISCSVAVPASACSCGPDLVYHFVVFVPVLFTALVLCLLDRIHHSFVHIFIPACVLLFILISCSTFMYLFGDLPVQLRHFFIYSAVVAFISYVFSFGSDGTYHAAFSFSSAIAIPVLLSPSHFLFVL